MRGAAYFLNGQYDLAISDCTKAIEIYPGDRLAYYHRGHAYFKKGFYDQAVSDYTKVTEINPKDNDAYEMRGDVNISKGLYDQSISDYTKAIEINPSSLLYRKRGFAYFKKTMFDQAIEDTSKSIELNSNDPEAYTIRGFARLGVVRGFPFQETDKLNKALADFNFAIQIDQNWAEAHKGRAVVHTLKGEFRQTILECDMAIQINVQDAACYDLRGNAYWAGVNDKDRACSDWKRSCELGLCEKYNEAKEKGNCD
jgi:tetratricopeptide (TPR) repeat protein